MVKYYLRLKSMWNFSLRGYHEKPRAVRPGVFRHASGDLPLRSDN
jgi:hypothetical protein